jgi:hypothetical protein
MLTLPGLPRSLNYGQLVNRACPLNRGLVSWWLTLPQRGKGNTFFDIAGANHGTLTNGPTWTGATGRPGGCGAILLDGTNDYVTVTSGSLSNIFTADRLTVSCWLKPTANPAQFDCLISHVTDSGWGNGWIFWFNSATDLRFAVQGYDTNRAIGTIPGNVWCHAIGTYDGTNVSIYINGVQGTDDPYAGAITAPVGDMEIGRGKGDSFNFNGAIDSVRVYDYALSASMAAALYREELATYPTTLNRVSPLTVFDVGGGAPPATNRRRRILICGAAA